METLYEILSPSPELRDYVEDFGRLSVLYQILRNAYRKKTVLYTEVARKTEMLVRESAATYGLQTTLPPVKINETTLRTLKARGQSDNNKIINLTASIAATVAAEGTEQPYLKPIGERAETIRQAFDDRQLTAQAALKQIEMLVQEVVDAQSEQKTMGLDAGTFGLYWVLREENIEDAANLAVSVAGIFKRFPNAWHNMAEWRQIKAELYKLVMPVVGKEKMLVLVERLLKVGVR